MKSRSCSLERLHGGDIGESYRATLSKGDLVFVKAYRSGGGAIEQSEARGLAWLRRANAIRVPEVIAVSDNQTGPHFLILEHLVSSARSPNYDEALGRGLAKLHAAGPEHFGAEADGYIGPLPQQNRPGDSWVDFYRTQRLGPLIELARSQGHLSAKASAPLDHLLDTLEEFVGPKEPPARLHGDLWSGNQLVGPHGEPCLIDPAAYAGHREVDLAMMRLFGGYSAHVFDSYNEAFPLALGHEKRVALYQLYPLLVHLVLFGAGYESAVLRAAQDTLAS